MDEPAAVGLFEQLAVCQRVVQRRRDTRQVGLLQLRCPACCRDVDTAQRRRRLIIIFFHHIICTFSNPVSTHDSPTCGDAQFLT